MYQFFFYTSNAELDYENLKFNNFKDRLLNKYKYMFVDAFIQHLKFKGYKAKFLNKRFYDMLFTSTSYYKQYREVALKMQKVEMLASLSPYTPNVEQLFSNETVLKDFLGLTDEFILQDAIRKRKETEADAPEEIDDADAFDAPSAGRPPESEADAAVDAPEADADDLAGATFEQ